MLDYQAESVSVDEALTFVSIVSLGSCCCFLFCLSPTVALSYGIIFQILFLFLFLFLFPLDSPFSCFFVFIVS